MSATLALVVAFLNPNPRKEQPQHKHVKTPIHMLPAIKKQAPTTLNETINAIFLVFSLELISIFSSSLVDSSVSS